MLPLVAALSLDSLSLGHSLNPKAPDQLLHLSSIYLPCKETTRKTMWTTPTTGRTPPPIGRGLSASV